MFLRIYEHLLPRAQAWRLEIGCQIREFFEGLANQHAEIKTFFDYVWLELWPNSTQSLDDWDDQFALNRTGLTETERRSRLDAVWKATGGQSPRYIQDTLQAAGFDVYVHEFWVPGSEPAIGVHGCATVRDPRAYLHQPGEVAPDGYPLVNKQIDSRPDYLVLCGETTAECGEAAALCGNFTQFVQFRREPRIPDDSTKWPYFVYIGGETFPTQASVPASRQDEFETLVLKLKPAQLWAGVLVDYT